MNGLMASDGCGIVEADATGIVVMEDGRAVRIHSARDPIAEAERLLDPALKDGPPVIIVIGTGLGYVLDAIERRWRATRVLAIEPSPVLARAMLARRDWQSWFAAERLTLLVGPDYAGAADAWSMIDSHGDGPPIVVPPVLDRLYPAAVARARNLAHRIVAGAQANEDARRRFAGRYLLNTLTNLPAICAESDASRLTGALAGVPAVVVAAGPSLDRNLPHLARVADRVAIIAVDTAVRPLLAAGLRPHVAVAVDPSELNARHLKDLPDARDIWLAAEGSIDSSVLDRFTGRSFVFKVSDHEPWPWLRGMGIDRGTLKAWGSVLTTAFDLAIRMDCSSIVFAGADLAYTDGLQYCRNTVYEPQWAPLETDAERAAAFATWLQDRPTLAEPDVRGGTVVTAPHFVHFRDWLASRAKEAGRPVLNGTGGGILLGDGITPLNLAGWTPGDTTLTDAAIRERLAALWSDGAHERASARRRLAAAVTAESGIPITGWLDFTRQTVTPEQIRSTLSSALGL